MSQQTNNTLINIASCTATTPIKDAALVVEGGGQRGIFTAGILDNWLTMLKASSALPYLYKKGVAIFSQSSCRVV